MQQWVTGILRCPQTGQALHLRDVRDSESGPAAESLATADGTSYPVIGGIPRFVPSGNYAANFGLQWNRFRRSQLDSHSLVPISRERFFRFSAWKSEDLAGKLVLDVGCGAGRFAEVALSAGARVVALDYSSAVDACFANLGESPNLAVIQGDIYHLPFRPASFDYVYCFGVLQHTPDVHAAFAALPRMVKPGGRLAVDVYPRLWQNVFWPKYWLRPITRRIPPERLFRIVERWVPRLLPLSRGVSRVPLVGRKLRFMIPVANHEPDYALDPRQQEEWAVLDTFDMFSPAHDHPQSLDALRCWFEEAGFVDVWTGRLGFNVGRGMRPAGRADC